MKAEIKDRSADNPEEYSPFESQVQLKMVFMRSKNPYALHPSLKSFPTVAFEIVPMFV